MIIAVNLEKARQIAHDKRRSSRSDEFAPLDRQISYQIPGTDIAAIETARQAIRDKYATIQTQIDEATDVEALKSIIDTF